MTNPAADPTGTGRPPRLAILSYSSGEFDARAARIARSSVNAGFEVVLYARLQDGLPAIEERPGYRVVRVPVSWRGAIPGVRRLRTGPGRSVAPATPGPAEAVASSSGTGPRAAPSMQSRAAQAMGRFGDALRAVLMFPVRPVVWSRNLDRVAEPADVWHGMWAGSLPALARQSRRLGGRTVYDSRDIYMESRLFATTFRPLRSVLAMVERRWARRADRVLTVSDAYAGILARQLRVPRPVVVVNCPDRWTPGDPPPDRIRAVTGLPSTTAIALYQGQLISDRGIEQAMDAIVEVPGAALALLGFGPLRAELEARARRPPYAGRVFVLAAVPPDDLLAWTASADVSVMPIQATSLNHRYTTPQKLFESLAAGVPVVASDLPGMAEVVHAADGGVLVDPASPDSIAAGIRSVLEAPAADRAARRTRLLAVAHERYTWEAQTVVLFELYDALLR